MDSLIFRCPGCQQPFQVLAEQAGQMVRCPSCEEPVQIPATSPQSKPAAVNPAAATPAASTQAEQVQPYDCPECDKPFGIYRSMYGSKMACPHCQKTVLLQKANNPQSDVTSEAVPQAKKNKRKQPQETRPKVQPQVDLKKKSAKANDKAAANATSVPAPKQADEDKETVSPINVAPAETPAVDSAVEPAPTVATVFAPQSVEHLLPPKFQAVDPAFFYRRHQDGSQVLLPGEDGSVNVVDNRIVRIQHNGQTYELISSPRYDRIQKSIVTNLLAVVICGLVIAIVMTLLNQ